LASTIKTNYLIFSNWIITMWTIWH